MDSDCAPNHFLPLFIQKIGRPLGFLLHPLAILSTSLKYEIHPRYKRSVRLQYAYILSISVRQKLCIRSMYALFPPSFRFPRQRKRVSRMQRGKTGRCTDTNGDVSYLSRMCGGFRSDTPEISSALKVLSGSKLLERMTRESTDGERIERMKHVFIGYTTDP